jgi:hypothetical protein
MASSPGFSTCSKRYTTRMRTLARRKLVILQPYSLTAYGLPMARHRVRLAENPVRGGCVRGFLETQLEPIVINPDSLLPPPATADHS